MNAVPDSVFSNWLSLSSLSCWTCSASSEPYVAVAMRQPPPEDFSSVWITLQIPFTNWVPAPQFGVDITSATGSEVYSATGSSKLI